MESPVPAPSPVAPPMPPAPVPPAPPPVPAPMPMEPGGPVPRSGGNFLEGITLMDVGMVALVTLALFYSIYASRLTVNYIKSRQQQLAAPPLPAAPPAAAASATAS